jgi:cytochrome c oxidase assembly factor CtaG
LDLLSDQRLGGVMMWVPGALVLWIGISVVYFRWSQPEVREDDESMTRPASAGGIPMAPPPYRDV